MIIDAVKFTRTPDITVINQEQFDAHYGLYTGYVNSINQITEKLAVVSEEDKKAANTTNGVYRGLKRGETYALNGVMLHELYFRNIGGTITEPNDTVRRLIDQYYANMEVWAEDFIATAKASRGWAILCFEQRTHMLRNISLDTHDDGMVTFILPLIVLDMYEHAYMIQYGTDKSKYIKAFMQNIHWDIVSQRIKLWGLEVE